MDLIKTIKKVVKHFNTENITVNGDSVDVRDRYGKTVYIEFLSDSVALVNGKRRERTSVHVQDHFSDELLIKRESLENFIVRTINYAQSFEDWQNHINQ